MNPRRDVQRKNGGAIQSKVTGARAAKMHMWLRMMLAAVIGVATCLVLLPGFGVPDVDATAHADEVVATGPLTNVPYLDVHGELQVTTDGEAVKRVTAEDTEWDGGDSAEWYLVEGDITLSHRVVVRGSVDLILADGATLTAPKGIEVPWDNSSQDEGDRGALFVFSQSCEDGVEGALTAAAQTGTGDAAIGGSAGVRGGVITVVGGRIAAFGGAEGGAGIGGGSGRSIVDVDVFNGVVSATGGSGAAGIGGGRMGGSGHLRFSGRRVLATGGSGAAGIGAGEGGRCGNIEIRGGTVSANSIGYAADASGEDVSGSLSVNGGAFVQVDAINVPTSTTSGVVMVGDHGEVTGSPVLTADAAIASTQTLNVPSGATLGIAAGATLTNHGVIRYDGDLVVDGTLVNNGTLTGTGTIAGAGTVLDGPGSVIVDSTADTNYLHVDVMDGGGELADKILDAYARRELANGKDVTVWAQSVRNADPDSAAQFGGHMNDYLPSAYFDLTMYRQIDGESPAECPDRTRHDAPVSFQLTLPDDHAEAGPRLTTEFAVFSAYDGSVEELTTTFDAATKTVTFQTNRFGAFALGIKVTRHDGTLVYPVYVRDSYAENSGQGFYAAGETVTLDAGVRDGYMVDVWVGSPEFTVLGSSRASFVMPAKAIMVRPAWVRVGTVNDVTDVSGNAFHASLVDAGVDLAWKVLDSDAMSAFTGGHDADIWLRALNGVSDQDSRIVAEQLGDRTLIGEFDLTLFSRVNDVETQVHKTNSPIGVRLSLPDPATGANHTYQVIGVHDGEATVINADFDAATKTLAFETDRFSAYAIVCTDAASGDPTPAPDANGSGNTGMTTGDGDAAAGPAADGVSGMANPGPGHYGTGGTNYRSGTLGSTGVEIGAVIVTAMVLIAFAVTMLASNRGEAGGR